MPVVQLYSSADITFIHIWPGDEFRYLRHNPLTDELIRITKNYVIRIR